MKRRLTQFLFALGLLLTLAAGTLWVRGFWVSSGLRVGRAWAEGDWRTYAYLDITVSTREVQLFWRHHARIAARVALDNDGFHPIGFYTMGYTREPDRFALMQGDSSDPPWERVGFRLRSDVAPQKPTESLTDRLFAAPTWFVLITCAAIAAFPFASLRRRRSRLARGLCLACGYDLRGADHERCPECGEVVSHESHGDPSCLSKMK